MSQTNESNAAPGAGAQIQPADQHAQAVAAGAPNQASQKLKGTDVQTLPSDPLLVKNGQVRPGSKADNTVYAEVVRARRRGEYDGVREAGDVFPNPRNLPTYPEDQNSWIEDADRDPDEEGETIEAAPTQKRGRGRR